MNTDIAQGKWKEFKGMVRENWGKLTEDEVEQTNGNVDQIAGKLQAKYGYKIDEARKMVNGLLNKINDKV